MVRSSSDGTIDNELVNDRFGRNGTRPRHYAKSNCNLSRNAEPFLEDDNGDNANGN